MSRALKTTRKAAARKRPRAAIKREAGSRRAKARVPAKGKATAVKTRAPGQARGQGPRTLGELMAQALAMEIEAAQRYADFADAMDTHNNREVAALFRKMAAIESKHAAQIMAAMEWKAPPAPESGKPYWEGFEAPETTPGDEVHYLMQPYHALQLALVNEQRAERFFARLVRAATVESVRKAAGELQAEEREHVALIKAWMKKTPKPDRYWANDPDPARYTD
jgi:rubrerythrin